GAVAVLPRAGRHAHERQLRDVAADGGLRDADTALGELLGDLGLRGEELALHELGDQPLSVLLAWHLYAVYTHHVRHRGEGGAAADRVPGARPRGHRDRLVERRLRPPRKARVPLPRRLERRGASRGGARVRPAGGVRRGGTARSRKTRRRASSRGTTRRGSTTRSEPSRRARSRRALQAAATSGGQSSSSNGLLNVCGASTLTGSTVRRTSSRLGRLSSSLHLTWSERMSSFMARETVFSFLGTSSTSRTVGTPNLSCAAR